ncbi:PREDICTED: uncharacterized protein LOC108613804 [Drosophila arizonae]|uniref:Uncharacterized protein LOC108613804 n=1 Tax=Drosophila arizonae TaxID=7263 RepID=A0ABM1P736_DROAR|nr:PREDICTED: uncharacterized protein LOC108613804 [Drosophila arizonae]
MQAHRRAAAIPLLSGAANYKEWSQKVELQMRIQKIWPAVIGPPVPIEHERVETETRPDLGLQDYTYVASRKHIYIQSSELVTRRAKLFLFRLLDPKIVTGDFIDMSVPCLWRALKRRYGHVKSSPKRKLRAVEMQEVCKKPIMGHRGGA